MVHTYLRLTDFVKKCGLLDFDTLCRSYPRGFFLDLVIEGFLGTPPEHLPPAQFSKLKLDDPRISDAYKCALHKQFEQHNAYQSESAEWNIADEAKYEGVDRVIGSAMEYAQKVCSARKLHTTNWSKTIGRATHSSRYWDIRIKRKDVCDLNYGVLNYYLTRSNVDMEAFDKTLLLSECHRQSQKIRAKLKDMITDAKDNGTAYEMEVVIARVHKRHPESLDDPVL
jgi:hypothetical protein